MKRKGVLSVLASALKPILRNQVYVARGNRLTAGLKHRGGFGFVPKKSLTREHMFLKGLNFRDKTIYDVGGHIGRLTLFFARETGETGTVVTFEPNPQNYLAILDHVELNCFTNVRVIQMGLGSKRETLKFVVTGSAQGTADPNKQEFLLKQKGAKVFHIEVDTMDNQIAVNNLPKPDFVKIDVEGLGIDVLRGMSQTISTYRPEIIIELHRTSRQEIAEFLLANGYKIYQVEDDIDITYQNIDMIHGHLYAY
jgi:FkbM family methyltransferase